MRKVLLNLIFLQGIQEDERVFFLGLHHEKLYMQTIVQNLLLIPRLNMAYLKEIPFMKI